MPFTTQIPSAFARAQSIAQWNSRRFRGSLRNSRSLPFAQNAASKPRAQRFRLNVQALIEGNDKSNNGGGMRMPEVPPDVDPSLFQVLGVPGVEITPETRMQDGTIIKGNLSQLTGTFEEERDSEALSMELSWDPDNVMKEPADDDLISRNMKQREERFEQERLEAESEERKRLRAELEEFRSSRTIPTDDPKMLLEYLVSTEINELEFEMTRCRPQMTDAFFEVVENEVLVSVESERKEQIKSMLKAAREFVAFMDANVKALASPAEKLKALLTSEDKRTKIADMAAEGEIDDPFMALFFTNIDMAYSSGNAQAGDYMKTIYDHCKKFQNA
mmetsp:Transcript_26430/g.49876  ORF Transcript_26430/g.49876 Transcript_26430/m.49876 type:complete len:332 (+) Transcript_26430:103-1098(+)|eukprot:CAMPEP_0114301516 /NCGR_PEP_ID=MMETSP0059-20121206/14150_1 /TAXON_ID=36894 /ORGANISM="Pyramimonas parkeae, Strain CCMP726" /LENGTH=331 /DNA_ID=CAMNT_0001424263 /DNA_START=76 /DNA_END=1071 /DNA_ORIENTATION=-